MSCTKAKKDTQVKHIWHIFATANTKLLYKMRYLCYIFRELFAVSCKLAKELNIGQNLCLQKRKMTKLFAVYISYHENYTIDDKIQLRTKVPVSVQHPGVEGRTVM